MENFVDGLEFSSFSQSPVNSHRLEVFCFFFVFVAQGIDPKAFALNFIMSSFLLFKNRSHQVAKLPRFDLNS